MQGRGQGFESPRLHYMRILHNSKLWGVLVVVFLGMFAGVAFLILTNDNFVQSDETTIRYTTQSIGPVPVLGLVVDENLNVVDVEKESAAEKVGVLKGDKITKVSGVNVKSGIDAKRMMGGVNEDKDVALSINRNSEQLNIIVGVGYPPARPGQPTPTAVPPNEIYF